MKSLLKTPTKECSFWFLFCFNVVLSLGPSSGEVTLQEHVGRTIEHFKLRLHNTLEENRIRRSRSTFEDGTQHSEVPNPYINQLESSEDASSVSVWCLVTVNGTEVVFAGTSDGSISIFHDFELISLHEFSPNEPIYSLLAFQYGNRLWLVSLHLEKQNKHFMQVYEYDYNSTINVRQRINVLGDSFISTVTIERTPYLVLIRNKDFKKDSNLVLFVWTGTQFDEILTFSLLSKCQGLIAWQIDKVLFFAASLSDKNQLTIWRFAKYYGKFIPVQMLEGNFHILKHFENAGSDYLVCGMENKVVIFWWSGVTFLKQQEFHSSDSDNIADLFILMLSQEETVIISVKKNQLEYFVQGSSTSYIKTGNKTLDSPILKSSTLWNDDGKFYILPVFQDLHPVQIFELNLNFTVLPPFMEIMNPQNCSGNFYEVVKAKQDQILQIHSKIGKIWRKDKPGLVSSVHVQGSVVSKKPSSIKKVFLSRTYEVPNILSTLSIYDKLNRLLHNLIFGIENVVLKSKDQNITGNVNFIKGIQVKEGNIEELSDHTKINGVQTLAFSSVLKVNGSQVFSNTVSLEEAYATFISSKILNSLNVKDYLLLDKQETISGNLIFQDITVSDMTVLNEAVNDLELVDIVISSGQQNIQNKKFSFLSSYSLTSTGHVAGIKSSELKKIIKNDTPKLDMKLNFTSVITIEDITLHTINGIDLMNLWNSTKRSGDEIIRGSKLFSYPVNIKELFVLGQVNQFSLNHLMTLHTLQNISNIIKFTNVSFNDIETHLLNEIDLCSDAILKCGHFEVNKTVKFLKPLEASYITMKDGIRINNVDVSSYKSLLLSQTHYVNDSVDVSSIVALNDVQIDDEDISSLIYKLDTNVWLKTSHQTISKGNFKFLSLKDDLIVQTVNGISLDDLALTDGNVSFNSSKEFGNVSIKSLIIQDGKPFNNTFISPNMISAIEEMLSILHVVNMTIKGNLITDEINDVSLSNWMHVERMQHCSGINTFARIMLHELEADQVNLNRFFEIDFDSYRKKSVLSFPNKTILNKIFTHIKGKEMVTRGFINSKEFEEMLKSVVTLNTKQNISKVNFGEIKTKALSVVNFNIADLSKVVSIVAPGYHVSSKTFTGNVTVENMQLYGKLQDVDVLALQKYAFYKGKNNSVLHPVTILADLKAKTIEIPQYSTIDGINLDDLIKLNRNFYSKFMHFSSIRLKNADMYGEINGCDLWDIAIPKNCTKILAIKHISQLKVDGNLFIESIVNGVPSDKISEILSNFDFVNKNLYFSNLVATNLQIGDVNGIDVNFLIRDAVKQSEFEIIKGKKHFKNKLISSNISIGALQVGSWLCGLNIPQLYGKYLSKQEKQKIYIRNLHKVKARYITIKGTLNKIKLPDDVVLTNTEEYIPLMNFNSSISMNSDLNIYGGIDNVTLTHFVNNRVTLNGSETLMTPLVFLKDVDIKDLVIKGQVNEILLANTVKRIGNYAIRGSKTFQRNLYLQSHLILFSLINHISIDDLLVNLYQNYENEHVPNMVNFKGIETSSLKVKYINNISLDKLWDEIDDIEKNSHGMIQTFSFIYFEEKELLLKVKDEIEDIFPYYGFFELQQELYIGPTAQFFPIYESGISGEHFELPTSKMIVWVNQNETCKPYKSFEMNVSSDGILTKAKEFQGRIFSFPLRMHDSDIESFVLHTDRTKICAIPNHDILKTMFKNGDEKENTISAPPNHTVLQAQLLELEEGIYVLVAYTFEGDGDKMFLYEYDSENDVWFLSYKFYEWDISSFDIIFISDFLPSGIHLAVTSANHPGIYHYIWDLQDNKFKLKTMYPKSVSTAALWVRNEAYIFLLLAKEKTEVKKKNWAYVYTEPIEVHVLEKETFKLSHTINIQGISSFERFDFDGEMYVLAVSSHLQAIYVIQYRGYNGFEVIQKIDAPGVVKASVFSSTNEDLLLAIGSNTGHTRILKCIARGNLDMYD